VCDTVRVPNRYEDDLSTLQGLHLIQESDSAKHLLAYGIRALRTAAFIETTRDPIMTMLSVGVEKMLKLSLGLLHIENHRVWLPARVLKADYRHDLIKMEGLLRQAIRDNIDRATHRSYVDRALAAVEDDPVWPAMIAALNRYGQEGRFYTSMHLRRTLSVRKARKLFGTPRSGKPSKISLNLTPCSSECSGLLVVRRVLREAQ
jgi:hypothetical protein